MYYSAALDLLQMEGLASHSIQDQDQVQESETEVNLTVKLSPSNDSKDDSESYRYVEDGDEDLSDRAVEDEKDEDLVAESDIYTGRTADTTTTAAAQSDSVTAQRQLAEIRRHATRMDRGRVMSSTRDMSVWAQPPGPVSENQSPPRSRSPELSR